jgi:hypothetical protein
MPTTARQVVTDALWEAGVVGVGQTPLAQDMNKGFTRLTNMAGQWQKRRWLVPALRVISAVGNGAVSRTVGPAGAFNVTPRPDKIQAAYFIQNNVGDNPVSFPLRPIFSFEDYARIQLKQLDSFPMAFFYDNAWQDGFGNLYVWPIPSSVYTVSIVVKANLDFPATLDEEFELPEEYMEAIHYNLAIRLCSLYQVPPEQSTVGLAKTSLDTIKNANVQIPAMTMPPALRKRRGLSIYNPDGY